MLNEPLITLDVENQVSEVKEPKWKRLHAWIVMFVFIGCFSATAYFLIMFLVDGKTTKTYLLIACMFASSFFFSEGVFEYKYAQTALQYFELI